MSEARSFARCSCPVCPSRTGGTCSIVLDAWYTYGVVCPCTGGCNRQYPECCYVDRDGEVANSCDDCGGGSHRVCACCGDQGNDAPHDQRPRKKKRRLGTKAHSKRQVA